MKMKFFKKALAFTLAEVLITLSILGVVAAITVPSLAKRNEERSTVTKVLKTYSALATQADTMIAEYGAPPKWNVSDLYKKLNYTKLCLNANQKCGATSAKRNLDGSYDWIIPDTHEMPLVVLKDGVVISTFGFSGTCEATQEELTGVCWGANVDINGPKGPNQLGKDIFQFTITRNGVFADPHNDCTLSGNGYGCASYIVKNKNMNYLH